MMNDNALHRVWCDYQGTPRVPWVSFLQGGYPAENPILARVCGHLGYPGYPFSIKKIDKE